MIFEEVLHRILDSSDVTVGGGSASAISGAMGAGLIGMVAGLSKDKGFEMGNMEYDDLVSKLDILSKTLLEGSINDTQAYLGIKDAFRMPKSTEEEIEKRRKAIQDAAVIAAEVPRDNGYLCKEVYKLGKSIEDKYNLSAESDYLIGMELAKIGIIGCSKNIEANLSLIKDLEIKKRLEVDISSLSTKEENQ